MRLLVDTTEKGRLVFKLFNDKAEVGAFYKITNNLSENILPALERFLLIKKIKLEDIKKISVNPGPGAFSSTRTGVATANALNFALGLEEKIVLPKYDRAPNITKSKKRP